jgi:mono/diheme cytochrome c family protein
MTRALARLLPCLLAGLLSTSCLQALAPDVGPPAPMTTCDDDLDPAQAVSFRDAISPIFVRACNSCHVPGAAGFDRSGLDLSTYSSLRAGGTRSVGTIVVEGRPCASVLWQKVGAVPPFGVRMPKDAPPLADAEIALIHDWIAEGALDN